jgi:hypothetical protein
VKFQHLWWRIDKKIWFLLALLGCWAESTWTGHQDDGRRRKRIIDTMRPPRRFDWDWRRPATRSRGQSHWRRRSSAIGGRR